MKNKSTIELPTPAYTVTDDDHKYSAVLPGGNTVGPMQSVTTILKVMAKPALIGWAAGEAARYFKAELMRLGKSALTPDMLEKIAKEAAQAHNRKKDAAADLGTKCHEIFQDIIQKKELDIDDVPAELREPARDFVRWRLESDIEIVSMELPVASLKYAFGGRLDAVGYSESRGGFGIVDYKTSSGFYGNEFAYQVGGYACALAEQYGVEVKWAEIIRFGKKAPFESEARPVEDLTAAIKGFLTATELVRQNAVKLTSKVTFSTAETRKAEADAKKPAKKKSACPF